MRKFFVIAILMGLTLLFVVQKRNGTAKPVAGTKAVTQATTSASVRPISEHDWMKRSLDRVNEVKHQVAQQRKQDGTH
jgi:hypothetical protein